MFVLRNYALAPRPLSHRALYFLNFFNQNSPLETYRWRSTVLEKLEVAEWRSGALRLTLTTGRLENGANSVLVTVTA